MNSSAALDIFVVENDADTLTWFSLFLEQLGHKVRSASDLGSARIGLAGSAPDVLFCDIGLPDGDGWDLMNSGVVPPHVCAIALSGYGLASDGRRSLEAGFRRHLVKPVAPSEIEEILESAAEEKTRR